MNQTEYEERMQDQHYKELKVTASKHKSEGDYVFISYRGNSWKKVLSEIVYKLQKEYGLRIYFDKEFASETNIWIDQFKYNMDATRCKAFLCFIDEGYVTSYATLLELMHAMNKKSKLKDKIVGIDFEIDWGDLDDDSDTGLGKEDRGNPGYKDEKEAFDDEFDLLKDKEGYGEIKEYYKKGDTLRVCDCKSIMSIIRPKNRHQYAENEEFYVQHVLKHLFNVTEGSVFEDPDMIKKLINGDVITTDKKEDTNKKTEANEAKNSTETVTKASSQKKASEVAESGDVTDEYQEISLDDFLCKYTDAKDPKGKLKFTAKTFKKIQLIGKDECAKYSTDFYNVTSEMVRAFVDSMLKEKGIKYIEAANNNCGITNENKPFITAEEKKQKKTHYSQLKVEELSDWYMIAHFSPYGWIKQLKDRIEDADLKPEAFVLRYIKGEESSETSNPTAQEPKEKVVDQEKPQEEAAINDTNIQVDGPSPLRKPETSGKYTLSEFIKEKNKNTFTAECYKNKGICLLGIGEYEKYSVNFCKSLADLIYVFAVKAVNEKGMDFIEQAKREEKSTKNPIFNTMEECETRKKEGTKINYKQIEVEGFKDYCVNLKYGAYDYVACSLQYQVKALGAMDGIEDILDKFYLEY